MKVRNPGLPPRRTAPSSTEKELLVPHSDLRKKVISQTLYTSPIMQDNRQLSWASDPRMPCLVNKQGVQLWTTPSQPCVCPSSLKHQVGAEKGAGMSEREPSISNHVKKGLVQRWRQMQNSPGQAPPLILQNL